MHAPTVRASKPQPSKAPGSERAAGPVTTIAESAPGGAGCGYQSWPEPPWAWPAVAPSLRRWSGDSFLEPVVGVRLIVEGRYFLEAGGVIQVDRGPECLVGI